MCADRHKSYYNIPCTFDIESTTVENTAKSTPDKKAYMGFMYIWQFCIEDKVVMGRTWEEFDTLLTRLHQAFSLNDDKLLVIYVHYLAFEFQFMRNFLDVTSVFARKKRVPMKLECNHGFEFRCSYFLSNMSLEKFIKNTPNAIFNKQSGDDFDYKKDELEIEGFTSAEHNHDEIKGYYDLVNEEPSPLQ